MTWTDQKVRWEISGKVIFMELKIGDNKINGTNLKWYRYEYGIFGKVADTIASKKEKS